MEPCPWIQAISYRSAKELHIRVPLERGRPIRRYDRAIVGGQVGECRNKFFTYAFRACCMSVDTNSQWETTPSQIFISLEVRLSANVPGRH
jgi:hypothetical protein